MSEHTRVLCVCEHGYSRSVTIRQIVSRDPSVKAYACGTGENDQALVYITSDLVDWAELIIVAEDIQGEYIQNNFPEECKGKTIISLNIPDEYEYMDGELVQLINERLALALFESGEIH